MRNLICLLIIPGLLILTSARPVAAQATWITTFDHDFYNWATPHEDTFQFPPLEEQYEQVLLYYTIECPPAPDDCDPWDRLGYLRVLSDEPGVGIVPYEIARIVTPYDITGGSYPGTCTWVIDVTDYRLLLHDEVTLSNYIESWIGGDDGWIVTIEFAFYPGNVYWEAFEIVNLWTDYHITYGDPADPAEDYLKPIDVTIDPSAEGVMVRSYTTGHGQGNTHNAAEFSNKWHSVSVDGTSISHQLWRTDCNQNLCSPQGGSWQYPRAGWCPGDKADPWDVDITALAPPDSTVEIDYDVQPYENFCRPNNPDCINGVTCADCNYNYTGHTEPHYSHSSHVIFYRINPNLFADDFESGDNSAWSQTSGGQNRETAEEMRLPEAEQIRAIRSRHALD